MSTSRDLLEFFKVLVYRVLLTLRLYRRAAGPEGKR